MVFNRQRIKLLLGKIASLFREFPYLSHWIVLIIDLLIAIFAFTCSYLICYQLQNQVVLILPFSIKLLLNTVMISLSFLLFRTYKGIIRYFNLDDTLPIFFATTFATVGWIILSNGYKLFFHQTILPGNVFLINFILTIFFMLFFRVTVKLIYNFSEKNNLLVKKKTPILIFDVSPAIVSIADMIKNNSSSPFSVVGFISPNEKVTDKSILGLPVFSMKNEDVQMIKKKSPKAVLINPLEQGRDEKLTIVDYCEKNNLKILSMPPLTDWQNEQAAIDKIKNIQIEDLLGRVPITISTEEIGKTLANKCIMITGAAGSIGSEIVRQIANFQPHLLLLCDIAESPLHDLQLEINEKFPDLNFLPIICDVRNYNRMQKIFEMYRPTHLYHAAAYKHVPLMENHPCESVHTNVIGTKNAVDLSVKYGVEVFVMISTDKAVNPTNVMGASKRMAEIYVQSLDKHLEKNQKGKSNKIKIITTRFGNVLGSNGSVIPRFKKQIEEGGPITVTHPEIVRYFMTIPEACRLVLEASNMGKGGEIFVFDMGDPVKIVDLAKKMIRLAGFKPYDDIDIIFTGLRPGEKLYEELLADKETTKPTYNDKIMIGTVRENYEYMEVEQQLMQLHEVILDCLENETLQIIKKLVPEYKGVHPL